MGFTALDIIVILLVGGGLVFGWLRGFVAEILSLFAWFLAILALRLLHAPLAGALEGPIGTPSGAGVLAFIIIFGLVFVGGKMASRRLGSRVRNSIVGPLDRVLGAAFGALKGLIGATILFMVLNLAYGFVSRERPEWMTRSVSYNLLKASSGHMADLYEAQQNAMDEAETRNGQNAANDE